MLPFLKKKGKIKIYPKSRLTLCWDKGVCWTIGHKLINRPSQQNHLKVTTKNPNSHTWTKSQNYLNVTSELTTKYPELDKYLIFILQNKLNSLIKLGSYLFLCFSDLLCFLAVLDYKFSVLYNQNLSNLTIR